VSINAIKDAVKALAQSLQVATIFPAGLFVLVNAYLIMPKALPGVDIASPPIVTAIISLALMLSYTLYAFNFPLIRLFEGRIHVERYKLRIADFVQRWMEEKREKKRVQLEALLGRINDLRTQRVQFKNRLGFDPDEPDKRPLTGDESKYWQRLKIQLAQLERDLDLHYPSATDAVLPTNLGNTIAAFEDYPHTRYGMDSIALWPRFIPLLKEANYIDFVTQEKSVFDFLLNTCAVVILLGIEFVYLNLFWGNLLLSAAIGFAALLAAFGLYEGMTIAALQWGTTVRVAFDLYRHDLRRRLGLIPAGSFEEEYRRWLEVSRFILYRRKDIQFAEFMTQAQIDERERRGREEGEREKA